MLVVQQKDGSELLSVAEVAERLSCSTASVYKLVACGGLPHVRITSNAIRVSERDLAEFIRRRSAGRRS